MKKNKYLLKKSTYVVLACTFTLLVVYLLISPRIVAAWEAEVLMGVGSLFLLVGLVFPILFVIGAVLVAIGALWGDEKPEYVDQMGDGFDPFEDEPTVQNDLDRQRRTNHQAGPCVSDANIRVTPIPLAQETEYDYTFTVTSCEQDANYRITFTKAGSTQTAEAGTVEQSKTTIGSGTIFSREPITEFCIDTFTRKCVTI
jgi:hypothetical protein